MVVSLACPGVCMTGTMTNLESITVIQDMRTMSEIFPGRMITLYLQASVSDDV